LNRKVKILVQTNTALDLETAKENINSYDAFQVYEAISELMITRRFAQNDIIKHEDAIAIILFADAYTVLNNNENSKGICLTNIAHIHYKNRRFEKAANSYKNAADCSRKLFVESK
jgi:tetratricopeptide (TPR) repeat protein